MHAFGLLRRIPILGLAILLTGGLIGAVTAKGPIQVDPPSAYEDVTQTIQKLTQDLGQSECGGWNFTESVVGKIPAVQGLPGRANLFGLGGIGFAWELKSGMSRRDEWGGSQGDGFQFPESTNGLSTTCEVEELENDHCGNYFPYIHDPYVDNEPSCVPPDQLLPPPPEGASEYKCNFICDELNDWVRDVIVHDYEGIIWRAEKCRKSSCPAQDLPPFPPKCYVDDGEGGMRLVCHYDVTYCCSDAFLSDTENANCIPCSKEYDGDKTGCREGKIAPGGRQYISFYRRYLASYARDKVQEVSQDVATISGLVFRCYSRYTEFDPKLRRTGPPDQHCVIDFEPNPQALKKFQQMKQTQKGKGDYGQSSSASDPSYPAEKRPTMGGLWINNLPADSDSSETVPTTFGGAFSLLNAEKAEELIGAEAPLSLLVLDSVRLTPTAQVSNKQLFSSGSLIRAFDDSVSVVDRPGRRTITEWWQEQETEMHKLLTPPILRLLLPSPASLGVRADTSLLTPRTISTDRPGEPDGLPPHTKTIDMQLHADTPDLLDDVSKELADSLLLNVREEPIAVVVPLASPVELRAMAQGWLSWGKALEDLGGGGEQAAKQVSDRLLSYAKQIEDVRKLRAELAQYAGKVLTFQNEMSRAIAEWLEGNKSGFEGYQNEWQQRISTYQPLWQEAQQLMRKFHDKTNFPWCRNERFTTPVYSLLDPWMPGPVDRDLALDIDDIPSPSNGWFPRIRVEPMPDLVFDFTALRIGSGGVVVPVIKPVQLRLNLALFRVPTTAETPEDVTGRVEKIKKLPENIPEIPSVFAAVKQQILPTNVLKSDSPSPLHASLPAEPDNTSSVLRAIKQMLQQMNNVYEKFWKSLQEDRSEDINKWNCVDLGELPCVHVEMDLMERLTRIGARPAVLLKEDLQSLGYLRTESSSSASSLPFSAPDPIRTQPQCPRADWACQVINAEQRQPTSGWRAEGIERIPAEDALGQLREELRKKTVPKDKEDAFRYDVLPDETLPSFNVTLPIPLGPLFLSSSSASATAP